ncbi:hypothetical protein BLIN101_00026 [Brevibacterium linens]|uniref:Uncharacterized protein n=1 Tax=Brevibacterium linens TaxID=1703 RepID=A0A2H1HI55_BRELN|nr:hypothetical protein BLIN101_00026 [Brevibacterium linens]
MPGSEPGAKPGPTVTEAAEPGAFLTEAAEPGAFLTEAAGAAVPDAGSAPAGFEADAEVAAGPAGSEFAPGTGREDGADSAGRAASPGDPAAPSAEPDALVCSSSFIQRPRRFSRMRIETSMGVPLKPKVSRRRRMMNRR